MAATIQDVLMSWGRSRLITDAPNAHKPPGWVNKIQSPGDQADRLAAPILPEDEHVRVDAAVSELRNRKPDHYDVIVYSYQHGLPDQRIAEKCTWLSTGGKLERRSRSWVRAIRENAEHWIEGRIG